MLAEREKGPKTLSRLGEQLSIARNSLTFPEEARKRRNPNRAGGREGRGISGNKLCFEVLDEVNAISIDCCTKPKQSFFQHQSV